MHTNAQGFRRVALFLVFVGLFFSLVFSGADVAFQRTVHQGLENHLAMVREPCELMTPHDLAFGTLFELPRDREGDRARSLLNGLLRVVIAAVLAAVSVVWGVVRLGFWWKAFSGGVSEG